MIILLLIIISLVTFLCFIYRHQIRRKVADLTGGVQNNPVSFHVGGRANPGFNTLDNDRVTLGRDFHGVVEEGPVAGGESVRHDMGMVVPGPAGTAAFNNPVFEINEAQQVIRDFKPPQINKGDLYAPSDDAVTQEDNKI